MLPRPEVNFQRTPVSLILAALAVACELACTLRPELRPYYYNDLRLGILSPVWSGEVWRPFTTTLLHGNIFHAGFNVYWLVTFGAVLEPRFGSFRYLATVVLLAYVSTLPNFLLSNLDTPLDGQVGGVGLSGVGYGLFAMLWVGRRFRPEFEAVCNQDTVRLFALWFVFCVAATWFEVMPVANVAHAAGFVFGALYGLAAFDRARRGRWTALAAAATLLVLATMLGVPGHHLYEQHRRAMHQRDLRRQMERLQRDALTRTANGENARASRRLLRRGATRGSRRRPG